MSLSSLLSVAQKLFIHCNLLGGKSNFSGFESFRVCFQEFKIELLIIAYLQFHEHRVMAVIF